MCLFLDSLARKVHRATLLHFPALRQVELSMLQETGPRPRKMKHGRCIQSS